MPKPKSAAKPSVARKPGAPSLYMGVSEMMGILGLSRSTVYRKAEQGDIPKPIKIGRQLFRWRRAEVEEWLERMERSKGK